MMRKVIIKTVTLTIMFGMSMSVSAQNKHDYNRAWNTPTVGIDTSWHYGQFGALEWGAAKMDLSSLPAIPGLKYSSRIVSSPDEDGYKSIRFLIAARCLYNPAEFEAEQAICQSFLSDGITEIHKAFARDDEPRQIDPSRKCKDVSDLCNYYVDEIVNNLSEGGKPVIKGQELWPMWQEGLLITDCWSSGNCYTIFAATMDNSGNACNRKYYFTIETDADDATTYKCLTFEDIVPESGRAKFALKMLTNLKDASGTSYTDLYDCTGKRLHNPYYLGWMAAP